MTDNPQDPKPSRRRTIGRIIGVMACLVLLVVLCAIMFMQWAFGRMCGNHNLAAAPSPDGRLQAVVFERDCGAKTGFSTQVSIIPNGSSLPNKGGNAFVADDNDGAAPAGPGGGPALRAVWKNNHLLVIHHHPGAWVWVPDRNVRVRVGLLRWEQVAVRAIAP